MPRIVIISRVGVATKSGHRGRSLFSDQKVRYSQWFRGYRAPDSIVTNPIFQRELYLLG